MPLKLWELAKCAQYLSTFSNEHHILTIGFVFTSMNYNGLCKAKTQPDGIGSRLKIFPITMIKFGTEREREKKMTRNYEKKNGDANKHKI